MLANSPLLSRRNLALLPLAAALIWIAPDFGQIFRGRWQYTELRSGVQPPPVHWAERFFAFTPGVRWGLLTGIAMAIALIVVASQGEASRFVYVQF
jgi:hypothetical protein